MDQMQIFGHLLHNARVAMGKKQSDIARELGMSIKSVVVWETGEVLPAESKISVISEVYKIDLETLSKELEVARKYRKTLGRYFLNRICKPRDNNEIDLFPGELIQSHISHATNKRMGRN